MSLFNTSLYERQITEASIDCDGCEPKSSTVERDSVQRENFLDLGLRVGDTFIFNTERSHRHAQIVYSALNGEIATISDLNPVGHPGRIEVSFASRRIWLKPKYISLYGWVKSSTVERDSVQRENFQWVEQYAVKRYLYWRYCHLRCDDGIERVVKLHIPGAGKSVREGRSQLVKEAIALGKSPQEIEQLIASWSR